MAKGQNFLTRELATRAIIPDASNYVTSAVSFNQGDMLYLDSSSNLTNAPASTETGVNFLGIAPNDVVSGILRPPYIGTDVDAAVASGSIAGPQYGSIWKLQPKSGDVFTKGCKVYPNISSGVTRGVTSSSGSLKVVGIYQGATFTATSGSADIECLVGAVYPNSAPTF